jgi:hypothetical protein
VAASTRRLGLAAFCAAAGIALTTALLRDMTPYYMTTPLHVVLVGIIAFGLASLRGGVIAAGLRSGACLVAAAGFLLCATRAAHLQKHGDWPFNFFPLFNVSEAAQPTVPLLLMPAYGVAASGNFLCAEPLPDAHGALAQYLLHGYAVDMRLACARSDVKLGGAEPDRRHWLGLSRALFARIGVQPQRRLGSIGLVAAHPLSAGPAIEPPAAPVYPAYLPKFSAAPEERRLRIEPGADRHLAVSNIAFGFAPNPEVIATLAGKPLEPVAVDSVSRIYAIDAPGEVEITIHSLDAPDVDVVTF